MDIIHCTGKNSGNLKSDFIRPIIPLCLSTIAGAPSVATRTSLLSGTWQVLSILVPRVVSLCHQVQQFFFNGHAR